jgi:hypothetical protein
MPYSEILVVVSSLLCLLGAVAYIRDTIAGKTKPNRVTWSMWALAPLIGTGAAYSAGADFWALARIFLAGFLPLIILCATLVNPQSYWKITQFDVLCGATSLVSLVIWFGLKNPVLAVLAAATADAFASIPTLLKTWRYPETETAHTYLAGFFSILLVLPSIEVWDIPNAAFSLYLLCINALLTVFAYRGALMKRAAGLR